MPVEEKTTNGPGQSVVGVALAAVLAISGWTLVTVIEVAGDNRVVINDLTHIKADVLRLSTEMRAELERKADQRDLENFKKSIASIEDRIQKQRDRINEEHKVP